MNITAGELLRHVSVPLSQPLSANALRQSHTSTQRLASQHGIITSSDHKHRTHGRGELLWPDQYLHHSTRTTSQLPRYVDLPPRHRWPPTAYTPCYSSLRHPRQPQEAAHNQGDLCGDGEKISILQDGGAGMEGEYPAYFSCIRLSGLRRLVLPPAAISAASLITQSTLRAPTTPCNRSRVWIVLDCQPRRPARH